MSEIRRDVFDEALENLSRYQQTTEDGTYQLIPDVYQEIIFREECLGQLDRYVQVFADEELEQYLSDIALNITICANIQHRELYPGLGQNCLNGAEIVLTTLLGTDRTARLYYQALETLSTTDLLLPLSTVEPDQLVNSIIDQIDTEANDAYQRGRKVHTTDRPEDASLSVLSNLTANYVLAEKYDVVNDLIEVMIETYRLHQQISPDTSSILQYRDETSYEHEMKYVMECMGASFERIAAHRAMDELVTESESVLSTVLSYQDELRYPYSDPSEQSQYLQTTVIFYSQAIAGIAYIENDITDIASLLSSIHRHLKQLFEDINKERTQIQEITEEEWLVRAYALFIKSLLYHHKFELVDNWPNAIEAHVNEVFAPKEQCQFYKYIVEWAATRADMEPRPGWLIWILSHEGILSIAVDDDLDFVRYDNGHNILRLFFAACFGVIRRINLPDESAKLNDLLEARSEELDESYASLYQAMVEEFATIDEYLHR